MMQILKKSLAFLKAYPTLERTQAVRLDSNESENYLFEDGVMIDLPFERYPDNHAVALKKAIASTIGVAENQLLTGSGSSEILEWLIKSTVAPGEKILTAGPTFVMYKFYAELHECQYLEVPLNDDFSFDVNRLIRAIDEEQPRLVILCSPNNPTGTLIPEKDILKVIDHFSGLILLDEAYIEFAKGVESFVKRVNNYPHVIVTRTFSKAYGLASIRLGYAVSNPTIIAALTLSKTPYNLNSLTQYVGTEALKRISRVDAFVESMIARRDEFKIGLESLGLKVFPSAANFLFLEARPEDLFDQLAAKGILVRPFVFAKKYVRITIGTKTEMRLTLDAIKEIIDGL
jgi:histidinol-phosphate aminotransferase